jgi:UDP-N-acetylglucosamine diphosphorylase / glucose-1-phosphate thymidylyltransferase / UDP-N-acetylgalactosamine diphosphorylase / glucosamine-1-phosphate N-acetyltransferase / galactosamine-1-phosphate N-acetyltransferase
VNIVIPMAGRGSRLSEHHSGLPKPLIEVEGRPLWWWATGCLPLDYATRLVFVCLREHVETYDLVERFEKACPAYPVTVRVLDDVTDGQLRTVTEASELFDMTRPLLVFNADTWFSHDQEAFLREAACSDGLLGVARRDGDRWSFARIDERGDVVEVAEKRRISDLASTGLYYFRNTGRFLEDAEAMFRTEDRSHGEFFIAPLYQRMIDRGERIRTCLTTAFTPIGTPEELRAFQDDVATGAVQP